MKENAIYMAIIVFFLALQFLLIEAASSSELTTFKDSNNREFAYSIDSRLYAQTEENIEQVGWFTGSSVLDLKLRVRARISCDGYILDADTGNVIGWIKER